ncbi:hypothetical protein MNBD_GAMMA22-1885 [hydrothermal vent metagenome]|uniref:Wadjet protein JetD C-terminal domain-containing protein n=1 Tax=hydrothermal vent metagenome TaxID=652676 RepID=A0A3B0ZQU6_9ZZZZ
MPDYLDDNVVDKPPWLDEQQGIKNFLTSVLKKFESNNTLRFRITKKIIPELCDSAEISDTTWFLLNELCTDKYKIFEFKGTQSILDHSYLDRLLYFQANSEKTLRAWLKIPSQKSLLESWRSLVKQNKLKFTGETRNLTEKQIFVKGKNQNEILSGFILIRSYFNAGLTLRNLSACCFWGDSKFLDNKINLIKSLYPELKIIARPIVINIYLPKVIEGILFIENQDNYTQAVKSVKGISEKMNNLALIFSYGNKLSAERIRTQEGVSFHFHENSNLTMKNEFKKFWFVKSYNNWPVHFWGDLDDEGMRILYNLKQSFNTIEAWKKGYQPMLELLRNNNGHTAEQSGKLNQKEAIKTGCSYADDVLIPALKKCGQYVDQESIV